MTTHDDPGHPEPRLPTLMGLVLVTTACTGPEGDLEGSPRAYCPEQFVDDGELHDLVERDSNTVSPDARPFVRYVSAARLYNAGVCSDALSQLVEDLDEAINDVSGGEAPVAPEAIDPRGLLYRIDLRNYRWETSISVGGRRFEDHWEALAADLGATRTGTTMLDAEGVIDATRADLYVPFLGLGDGMTIARFLEEVLLVDPSEDPLPSLVESPTHGVGTMTVRELGAYPGVLSEFVPSSAPSTTEIMFSLPNGRSAFVATETPKAGAKAGLQVVLLPRSGVSCSACHAQGFLPVRDEIR